MPLKLYNTRTRQKEKFEPAHPGKVNLYVCGVTVYDECHVGHARVYVVFDVLVGYLEHLGWKVRYVRNITDVDDKIIEKARAEAAGGDLLEAVRRVTSRYTQKFQEAMGKMGIRLPDEEPRATDHVAEMIEMIQKLLQKGIAYAAGGDVYFDISRWQNYGALSGRSLDEMRAGARVEPDSRKKNPLDFALWKGAKPGEPAWDSPWGKGRPGWHIECSAMALKYLGSPVDIHGGGQDLIFPHHENELAQSEAATEKPFVRLWMHNGFVTVDKEKMSKSLGNFFALQDVFKKFAPRVVKFYLLTQHYRSPIDFSDAALAEAKESLAKIENALSRTRSKLGSGKEATDTREALAPFEEAMRDDLNTPRALACIFELVTKVNTLRERGESGKELWVSYAALNQILNILGIMVEYEEAPEAPQELRELLEEREKRRREKKFAEADQIRKKIMEAGYVIEDSPSGPQLRKKD